MTSVFVKRFMALGLLTFFSQNSMAESATQIDCPLIKQVDVLAIFPASKNAFSSKYREKPFPSCTFIWKSNTVQVKEFSGNKVEFPGESRVSITRAAVRSKDKDWQRVLAGYGTQPLTNIQNIGIKAVWSEKRHQLSVMTDAYVLHVAVEDPDQPTAEQQNAEHIAQLVLSRH
jgi:hypothetical protein